MFHTIKTTPEGLKAVEIGIGGKETGRTFIVPNDIPGGARSAIEQLISLKETVPPVMRHVTEVLEDIGFGRLTPAAITSGLLTAPEELAATIDALNAVFPDIKAISRGDYNAVGDMDLVTPPWEDPIRLSKA